MRSVDDSPAADADQPPRPMPDAGHREPANQRGPSFLNAASIGMSEQRCGPTCDKTRSEDVTLAARSDAMRLLSACRPSAKHDVGVSPGSNRHVLFVESVSKLAFHCDRSLDTFDHADDQVGLALGFELAREPDKSVSDVNVNRFAGRWIEPS